MGIVFKLLGRFEVVVAGRRATIHGTKPKQLLTALLLNPNTVVPVDRLVDALWPDDPPRSALENLRTYATAVRRCVTTPDGQGALTASRAGYLLSTTPDRVDVSVFTTLTAAARADLGQGRAEAAAAKLTEALVLWQGRAGEGLPRDGWIGMELHTLDELRLIAAEERADILLGLGRHAELVPELMRLVAEEPLRERLWRLLMLAQYRGGGAGEALRTYARARRILAEELAIEPGTELSSLHQAILRRNEGLLGPPCPTTASRGGQSEAVPRSTNPQQCPPRQVPAPPPTFVGRQDQRARIRQALARAVDGPVAVAVSGLPGVGKSALAFVAARAAHDLFPDGQLYLNLRDFAQPASPTGMLPVARQLLRTLGRELPHEATFTEAACMVRSAIAHQRMLLVFDNVLWGPLVAPLLPAHAGSAAILTSQRMLDIDAVSHHVTVGPVPEADAVTLLRLIGGDRVGDEPDAAADVVRLCYGVPLAISAAAARLAGRAQWTVAALRDTLYDGVRLIRELRRGDASVRDTLATALRELSAVQPGSCGLLARLARWPDPIERGTLDRCCGDHSKAERRRRTDQLDALVDFHLLETPAPDVYQLPDAVRAFATGMVPSDRFRPMRLRTGRPVLLKLEPRPAAVTAVGLTVHKGR